VSGPTVFTVGVSGKDSLDAADPSKIGFTKKISTSTQQL